MVLTYLLFLLNPLLEDHIFITITLSTLICHIWRVLLILIYGQEEDKDNGTIPGQIGPRVPSGSILQDLLIFGELVYFFVFSVFFKFTLWLGATYTLVHK